MASTEAKTIREKISAASDSLESALELLEHLAGGETEEDRKASVQEEPRSQIERTALECTRVARMARRADELVTRIVNRLG